VVDVVLEELVDVDVDLVVVVLELLVDVDVDLVVVVLELLVDGGWFAAMTPPMRSKSAASAPPATCPGDGRPGVAM
jgi:hypothetical protein